MGLASCSKEETLTTGVGRARRRIEWERDKGKNNIGHHTVAS